MWDMEATYPVGGASFLLLRATETGVVFESMVTVPEPGTMVLLGVGGLLLMSWFSVKRKRRLAG